jgi:hypothetical protein
MGLQQITDSVLPVYMMDPAVLQTKSRGVTFNAPLVRSQLKQDNSFVRNLVESIWSSQEQQKSIADDPSSFAELIKLRDRGNKYYENLKAASPPKYLHVLMSEMKSLAEQLTEIIEDLKRLRTEDSEELLAVTKLWSSLTLDSI